MIRKITAFFLLILVSTGFGTAVIGQKFPVEPRFAVQPRFTSAMSFSEGLASVKVDGKWGYIDHNGKIVIKPAYDLAWRFSEELAPVNSGGIWGFIDKKGKYRIEPVFGWALSFTEGLAAVNIGGLGIGRWGFIDREGGVVIEPRFDIAWPFSEGAAIVEIDGKTLFIDKAGNVLKEERRFTDGVSPVLSRGKWGYIGRDGKIAIEPRFDTAFPFKDGIAVVVMGGRWGYIERLGERSGDFILKPGFAEIDFALNFSEGLSRVGVDDDGDMKSFTDDMAIDRWGYIDKTGRLIIDIRYEKAYDFSEGVAAVMVDGKWGYIENPLKGNIKR
ncbi:MAG: WG repeat-containing protein [Deltaproteobacteria bacterium]|uniref:WG repeat-containing protein n=1 Tax=Candidatus Zymogenus saltonus TaxID=2844893 RepID=A0A9D8PPB5_9DELT|nr:WG repeat-containing protein [Candidatus Zymogenus saltonus]